MRLIEIDPDCWVALYAAALLRRGETIRIVLALFDERLMFHTLGVRRADGRIAFGSGMFCANCGARRTTEICGCNWSYEPSDTVFCVRCGKVVSSGGQHRCVDGEQFS